MGFDVVYAILSEDHSLTLQIIGTLDLGIAHELKGQVDLHLERGLFEVEVDLGQTECVTSVGISVLAHVWERCSTLSIPVRFTNVSDNLRRLFEVAGVREIFLGSPSVRTPDAH